MTNKAKITQKAVKKVAEKNNMTVDEVIAEINNNNKLVIAAVDSLIWLEEMR